MTVVPLSRLLGGDLAPAHVLAVRDGRAVSLGRFQAEVSGLARRLRRESIRRAGLWCLDGYAFLVGLLGAACAGCALVLPPGDQRKLLEDLAPAWDRLVSDDPALDGALPIHGEASADPCVPFDPGAVLVDFFTSGSTAQPKRVPHTLGQLETEVAAVDARWTGLAAGLHHGTVPHQHIYGLVFRLLWPAMAGRPFSAERHDLWESLLAALADGDVLVTSPAHLARLGGIASAPRPALILSAGSPLPPAAARDTERVFGTPATEIYGSTETGAIATRRGGAPQECWTPLPGNRVGCNTRGLLCLDSPWVEGTHQGADLIEPAAEGRFRLLGRADRVVKIEGKRVGLAAVEAALTSLPAIADAAAIRLAGRREEVVAAVVLTAAGHTLLEHLGPFRLGRLLREHLADSLEPLARPRRWRFIDAIPSLGMGKRKDSAIAGLFNPDGRDG